MNFGGWSAAGPSKDTASRGPFLTGPGGVLMSPHDRGVDRRNSVEVALFVGLGERSGEDFSQVLSAAHLRSRLWAPFHESKYSGGSVHGVPVVVRERDRVDHLSVITSRPSRFDVWSGNNGPM